MINQTPQPLGLTCRVFKASTLEAALTEAQAKGYQTEVGYWWKNHLYLPTEERISVIVTEGEDY